MTITHATRGYKRLGFPRDAPSDQQWIYQLALPFQISPTEAALAVNVRLGRTPVVDLEVGGDYIIFDDIIHIDDSRCTIAHRAEVIDHPRTGEKIYMSECPPIPGFIPLGTKRPDGTPHPHAGTGFAMVFTMGYPVALGDNKDTHMDFSADVYSRIYLQQLRYDGKTLSITDTQQFDGDNFLPGTHTLFMSLTAAIPSGDDLISGLNTGVASKWDSGFARWRRGSDGKWALVEHKVLAECTHEPSLVRDIDGSLIMLFRPWSGNKESNRLLMMRSEDEGATWHRICDTPNFWQMCPMTVNTALDGTPYIMLNRFREPRINRHATREMIWAWPLSDDRTRLEEPIIVRDATTGFGPPPNGSVWRIDHPIGQTLRLRDGKWRHVIAYRGLEDAEMRTDAGATPMTGTYVEEMFSDGPARPAWKF